MSARPGSTNRASIYRGEDDFYPTPPSATWALCQLGILPEKVWEPACGDGAMARVLEQNGHHVVASDLRPRGYGEADVDFLTATELRAPAIVTNPPFKLADEFVLHALSLGPDVAAFFLRLKFLEGRRRYDRLLATQPPTEIHVFIERVKFFAGETPAANQPGWNTEAFAWFIWRRDHQGPPTIGWISRDQDMGAFG
jgi:hypothetical protein